MYLSLQDLHLLLLPVMQVLLTDTVGFIQKLPTQLVAAFRATLEEITEASLLLHVVDVSHPNAAAQTQAVMQVCPSFLLEAKRYLKLCKEGCVP